MIASLDPAVLAEKLSPPRPLTLVSQPFGAALVAAPREGAQGAWLAWLEVLPSERRRGHARALLDAAIAWSGATGARTLTAGGPPGNYLVPGVDASGWVAPWLERAGFCPVDESHNLVVDLTAAAGFRDPRVSPCEDRAALAWVAAQFSASWRDEAERALLRGGLFVARAGGAPVGFVCAHGNCGDLGTFGPVGVVDTARGHGVGAALARRAYAALAERGFERATVPWVSTETLPFYAGLAPVLSARRYLGLRRAL